MTSLRQIRANQRNALKSTGPNTAEGKDRSRCNAVRHGLTAETVIGALEDAEDYKAFEGAIIADYDAQSVVERELVLRLASILWRLRRATTMETGLFEIQAEQLLELRQASRAQAQSEKAMYAQFGRNDWIDFDRDQASTNTGPVAPSSVRDADPAVTFAKCFLRLANLPSYALDRLSRYEASLWRQCAQIVYALDALGRRRPQERSRFSYFRSRQEQPFDEDS